VGVTASAQTNNQAGGSNDQQVGQSKDEQGGQSRGQRNDSQREQESNQAQGQTERIRGELASVSVVGEMMVDHDTGRGIVAEFTYLTILGSPADAGRQGNRGGRADSGRDDANRGDQARDQGARSENKEQGSNRDQADGDRGIQGRLRERFANRRNVYQIAVGSETQVRSRGAQRGRGQDPGDQAKEQGASAGERSQSQLEELELGDRVEVEFTRLQGRDRQGSGAGGQGGSGNQARHGRHRIIRGVAKTITIVATPDQDGDQGNAENRRGDDSSSAGQKSGSDAKEKSSNQEK